MNGGQLSIQDTLPLALRRRVVQVCDRYEQAARAGQRPRIEDCVADVPEPERSAVLRELIALDLRLRRSAVRIRRLRVLRSLPRPGRADRFGHPVPGHRGP